MVFQQFNLFPHLTVKENITLAPVKLGVMKQEEADKKAEEPGDFWRTITIYGNVPGKSVTLDFWGTVK